MSKQLEMSFDCVIYCGVEGFCTVVGHFVFPYRILKCTCGTWVCQKLLYSEDCAWIIMGRKPLGLLGLFGLMDVPAVQLTLCRFPILCDLFDKKFRCLSNVSIRNCKVMCFDYILDNKVEVLWKLQYLEWFEFSWDALAPHLCFRSVFFLKV